jgi:hypothetical protein
LAEVQYFPYAEIDLVEKACRARAGGVKRKGVERHECVKQELLSERSLPREKGRRKVTPKASVVGWGAAATVREGGRRRNDEDGVQQQTQPPQKRTQRIGRKGDGRLNTDSFSFP